MSHDSYCPPKGRASGPATRAVGLWVGLLWCGTLAFGSPAAAQSPEATRGSDEARAASLQSGERERAVRLAREGRFDEALSVLTDLLEESPRNVSLRGDLAAVLSWAGRDDEALEVGERLPFAELDPVIGESVARSARNEGRPGVAVGIYRQTMGSTSQRLESRIGLALAYLEWDKPEEAERLARDLLKRAPADADVQVAVGHVLRAAGRAREAASHYRRALELEPGRSDALRGEVRALEEAGQLEVAIKRLRDHPQAVPREEWARLHAELGARLVREDPEAALAFLERALREVEEGIEGTHSLRMRADRVQALRELGRNEAVLRAVADLEAEGHRLPSYVHHAAADALVDLGRTEQALERVRTAVEQWPDDFRAHRRLFHLLADSGRLDGADAVMEGFLDRHPDHLDASVLRALGLARSGDLARAQEELETLLRRHPDSDEVRQELAAVFRWRGWPRRALAEYEAILHRDPTHGEAKIGRVAALLDAGRMTAAGAALESLRDDPRPVRSDGVRELERRRQVQRLWELAVDAGAGRSTGGELGTRDHTLRMRLISAPLAERVRFRFSSFRADADFEEGVGVHDLIAAGAELRTAPVRLVIEATGRRRDGGGVGVDSELEVQGGDRLSIRLAGQTRSVEVPLRAEPRGIHGWSLQGGVSWRAHESREWSGTVGLLEMSDDNRRWSGYLALEQTLSQRANGSFALRVEGYGATHARTDVPYFSPGRYASGAGSGVWRWTGWRVGAVPLIQELSVTGGVVMQQDEETLPMGVIRMEHDWRLSPRASLRYGASWGSPVYDGARERRTSLHAGFTWRLP